jgi:hypothetical protein
MKDGLKLNETEHRFKLLKVDTTIHISISIKEQIQIQSEDNKH